MHGNDTNFAGTNKKVTNSTSSTVYQLYISLPEKGNAMHCIQVYCKINQDFLSVVA